MGYYKEPLEAELDKSIQELEKAYRLQTQNIINPRRIALIHLIQGIQDTFHSKNIKIATMILGVYLIGGNLKYHLFSPKKVTILGYKIKGSELHDLLISGLKLNDPTNELDSCTAIEYLAELFDFLKKNLQVVNKLITLINSDESLSKPIWKNAEELLTCIENVASQILAEQSQGISDALYARLTSEFIKKRLIEIAQHYRSLKKGNAAHDLLADYMEFIAITSDFYGEASSNTNLKLTPELAKIFSRPYNILMGVVRYTMVELENETTLSNWFSFQQKAWSVKNSDLYKSLSATFSKNYSTDFSYAESHDFIDELSSHLRKFPYFKQTSLYKQNEVLFNQIEKNLNNIHFQLTEQKRILSAKGEIPSGVSARVGANVKYLTEFGVNTVVSKAASTIFVPEIGKQAVRAVGGAVGYVLFGPTGAFIGICLADHVATAYIQTTVSGFTVSAVHPLGSKLGSITGGVVSVAIYPAEQGIRYAFSSDPELAKKQREFIMHNEKFLSALCKFPDKIFSPEKKEIIEMTQENDKKGYSI